MTMCVHGPLAFARFAIAFMVIVIGSAYPGMALAAIDYSKSIENGPFNDAQGNAMPYRLFAPDGYNAPGAKYPLVLYLHGAGSRGTDNTTQINSAYHLLSATQGGFGAQYKAFLLAPQVPLPAPQTPLNNQWVNRDWALGSYTNAQEPAESVWMADAMSILDSVIAKYPVDASRIYITGISMGGCGTWDAIRRFPNRFAAAAPLSGEGNKEQGALLKNIPIWAYHGATDTAIPTALATDAMRDAVRAAGGSMEYTRPEDVGHEGWDTMYNKTDKNSQGQDLYQWMFAKSLPAPEPSTLAMLVTVGALALVTAATRRRIRR